MATLYFVKVFFVHLIVNYILKKLAEQETNHYSLKACQKTIHTQVLSFENESLNKLLFLLPHH